MNRRAFFSLFGSGVVGAVVAAKLPFSELVMAQRAVAVQPAVEVFTLKQMTQFVARRISDRMAGVPLVCHPERERRIGDAAGRAVYTDQFSAAMAPGGDGVLSALEVEAVADHLADTVREAGIRSFGRLAIPDVGDHGVLVSDARVSVRGLSAYDVMTDRYLTRFDVLGAKE